MKAIIDGKRYDTDKATECGSASSDLFSTDFGWWQETLYRTPRGKAYFLAGQGNARSHYATNLGGGSWGSGAKITPLTDEEARRWAERNLTTAETEALFADDITDA